MRYDEQRQARAYEREAAMAEKGKSGPTYTAPSASRLRAETARQQAVGPSIALTRGPHYPGGWYAQAAAKEAAFNANLAHPAPAGWLTHDVWMDHHFPPGGPPPAEFDEGGELLRSLAVGEFNEGQEEEFAEGEGYQEKGKSGPTYMAPTATQSRIEATRRQEVAADNAAAALAAGPSRLTMGTHVLTRNGNTGQVVGLHGARHGWPAHARVQYDVPENVYPYTALHPIHTLVDSNTGRGFDLTHPYTHSDMDEGDPAVPSSRPSPSSTSVYAPPAARPVPGQPVTTPSGLIGRVAIVPVGGKSPHVLIDLGEEGQPDLQWYHHSRLRDHLGRAFTGWPEGTGFDEAADEEVRGLERSHRIFQGARADVWGSHEKDLADEVQQARRRADRDAGHRRTTYEQEYGSDYAEADDEEVRRLEGVHRSFDLSRQQLGMAPGTPGWGNLTKAVADSLVHARRRADRDAGHRDRPEDYAEGDPPYPQTMYHGFPQSPGTQSRQNKQAVEEWERWEYGNRGRSVPPFHPTRPRPRPRGRGEQVPDVEGYTPGYAESDHYAEARCSAHEYVERNGGAQLSKAQKVRLLGWWASRHAV